MSKVYTTEITSEHIPSDNPIHQRLLRAYVLAQPYVFGDVLEVGCGEGRGIDLLLEKAKSFSAIDKLSSVVHRLQDKYPKANFFSGNIPPFEKLDENSFDCVVSFQVIEHINDDHFFLREIERVLKPGGVALLTTPNRLMSLTRNPWHIREYTSEELTVLAAQYFEDVQMKGISGNDKVMSYYQQNKKAVDRIARWDFLDLQHRLPSAVLRVPYEILNRWNRNKLQSSSDHLVSEIRHEDYLLTDDAHLALDLFLIVRK